MDGISSLGAIPQTTPSTPLISSTPILVVIDERLTDVEVLLQGVAPGATVLRLGHGDDIGTITQKIQQLGQPVAEIHLVSHGAPGILHLGCSELSLDTLPQWSAQLAQWFQGAATPQLVLYGCNAAAGDAGAEFIAKLHQITGAAIAASTTRMGSATLGGNWTFDATVGVTPNQVPAPAFSSSVQQRYAGVMVSLRFSDAQVEQGTGVNNVGAGDVFRFDDIILPDDPNTVVPPGQQVDALLTVVALNNGAQIVNLDDDEEDPLGLRPVIGAPNINGAAEATVDFRLSFFTTAVPNLTTPIALDFPVVLSDVDGDNTEREFRDLAGFQSFVVLDDDDPNTGSFIIDPTENPDGTTRFASTANNEEEFIDVANDEINPRIAVSLNYTGLSVLDFTLGLVNTNPGVAQELNPRQFALIFRETVANQITPPRVVSPSNTPPVATPDTATTGVDTPVVINLLANDTDQEDPNGTPGNGITRINGVDVVPNQAVPLPSGNGTVTLLPNGSVQFTPAQGFTGDQQFTYTVADSGGLTATATASVTVGTATGTPPVANNDTATTTPNTPITIDLLGNDTDADDPGGVPGGGITNINGVAVAVNQPVTLPSGAIVTLLPTGSISYDPGTFTGQEQFTYTVADSSGLTATATASIGVGTPAPGGPDNDGDGIPDAVDLDDDNDGIPDIDELQGDPNRDTDGDGIIDSLDLDADNDGILDVEEAGHGQADTDGDGRLDGPFGPNGLADIVETTPESGTLNYTIVDTDGDGVRDFQDLDSDNDGILDVIEGSLLPPEIIDPDGDGLVGGPMVTVDANGIPGTPVPPPDTDGDGTPDYRDLDSDNDGIDDIVERGGDLPDADMDGRVDGPDPDGDGIVQVVDGAEGEFGTGPIPVPAPSDDNGNGTPEYREPPLPTLVGGELFDQTLTGFSDPDTRTGTDGDDQLNGGSDDDVLRGGLGRDLLNGGSGADRLFGGAGGDLLNGGSGADRLFGGAGDDIINGGRGADRAVGGLGDDEINGGAGRDRLLGGRGRDTISGDRGDDIITGGAGRDILTGGQGRDVFRYDAAGGSDVITDFSIVADRINVRALGVGSFGNVSLRQRGDDAIVRVRVDGGRRRLALLEDVQASTLDSDNFIFA